MKSRLSLLSISQPALSQLPWCPFVINPTFIAYPAWDSQSRVPWGWKNPEVFKKIISPQLSVVKIICTAFSRVILQLQNVSVPLARVTYMSLNLDGSSYLRDFPPASQVSPSVCPVQLRMATYSHALLQSIALIRESITVMHMVLVHCVKHYTVHNISLHFSSLIPSPLPPRSAMWDNFTSSEVLKLWHCYIFNFSFTKQTQLLKLWCAN